LAISEEKARVVAIVLKETKREILKLAKREERSESSMAAKLLRIGLENYRYEKK
jgi:hypothetical protein